MNKKNLRVMKYIIFYCPLVYTVVQLLLQPFRPGVYRVVSLGGPKTEAIGYPMVVVRHD